MAENHSVKMVFHNTFSNRDFFEMPSGSRPWEIFLIISKGSFVFTNKSGEEFLIEENEIAYFPANSYFKRKIISPIDFHQFGFFIQESSPFTAQLKEGKLTIPKEHVRTITETMSVIARFFAHDKKHIFHHMISDIIMQNFIYSTQEYQIPIEQDNDIAFVVQYMSEHLSEKISIEQIAEELHLSHVGLLWKFKKKMKCTPSTFLFHLRMQYAKQLLLENKLRINEIAHLCGYNNAYYFSNAFKKYFHVSPTEYREKKQREIDSYNKKA